VNIYYSLHITGGDLIMTEAVHISDGFLSLPSLVLHKAIREEIRGMLHDMEPYLIEAVYKEMENEEKRKREEAPEGAPNSKERINEN
jgi:hypothetical protein